MPGPRSPKPRVRDDAFLRDAMRDWGATVYNLALVQTSSRADAEDIYQDVFLRLATCPTQFTGPEHLKAWLLRVTLNCCRDLRRSAWFRRVGPLEREAAPASLPDSLGPSAEDEASAAFAACELRAAVARLKPKLREAVYLHYVEDLDCNAIARMLGSRPSTIRTRLQRARDQLKSTLEGPRHDDPRA